MTVSYQYEVASSTSGGFTRLLFMWKGSLYKLIYRELLLFLAAFGLLSALYRNTFNSDQRKIFEKMVMYCDTFINLIPLSFVLGFYVAYVAGRWWQQYMAIPWPDKIMHSIALYVAGGDEHARVVRRTLMRYLNLTLILVLRSISSAVKRRFPTLEHVVEAGFMTSIELEMFQSVPSVEFNTYWIPCTWFISLLKETRKNNQIDDSQGLHIIMEEFNEFRSKCGLLWSYDWVSIPLVYTQVVTIATYSFFLAALVGRQYVDAAKKPLQMEIDIYLPVFTILQFFFFMGLLKVAEQLINPFGDDDEDFELNWLIDRHTKVSYLGVDILMTSAPPLVKDMYFDQVDLTLPYTEASVAYKKKTYRGSVHNMMVPEDKHTMFLPEICEEDEDRTPTPRSSLSTVQSMAHSRPPEPASVTAAAAGTWRSHFPSTQSFHKVLEVDPELEASATASHHVEMDMAAFLQEQKVGGEDMIVSGSEGEGKVTRPLSRSESVPAKKPVFVAESMLGWPSSSTLGHSNMSVRYSEQSIDVPSCCNSSSNLAVSAEKTLEQGCGSEGFSHIAARRSRGDSLSSSAGAAGNVADGRGSGTVSKGGSGAVASGSSCSVGGSGGVREYDADPTVAQRRQTVASEYYSADCVRDGVINDVESSRSGKNRLSLGLEVTCNHSSHLSQISLETPPPIPKQYEHYLSKRKDETEYVTFKKDFASACIAKVKSYPKLVLVKRQHSANNGRKKGVRWKPMVNNIPGRETGNLRRQTVEILPVTPDPSDGNLFFSNKTEIELLNQSVPETQCPWCKKQITYHQALYNRSIGDNEQYANTSGESVSSSSFTPELCPLHYKILSPENIRVYPVPSGRLVGTDGLHSKTLPFQERRATVSTLSLTGSELEAKRWQSRSFWERGFFKRMKLLYSQKGVKSVPTVVKRTSLFISNKRQLSQSLPNIAFPCNQSEPFSAATELLTLAPSNRAMPTLRISDMTSTESDGSSCFASIMEMQEEDDHNKKDDSRSVTEEKNIPMISLHLPASSPERVPNSVKYASDNSGEHLSTHSQDSSWQSADWTGIIDPDRKCHLTTYDETEQTRKPKEFCSVSSPKDRNLHASNTLQEVIIDNGSNSPSKEQSIESVS